MSKRSRVQNVTDVLLIAGFAAAIALPLSGDVFRLKIGPDLVEQRVPAPAPIWRQDSIFTLPAKFEKFYDDHFAFRNVLILAHNMLKRGLMRVSSEKVLIGKDDWLFYQPDTTDDLLGQSPLTPAGVESWRRAIEGRMAWLGERRVPYLFLLAPNQATLYPEYLPNWVRVNRSRTRRDEFLELVHRCPELAILDPTAALIAAKSQGLVYPPQGTHWSGWGSYTVYREVVQWLSQRRPGLTAPPLSAFALGNATSGYDLLDMLGLPRPDADTLSAEQIVPKMGWQAHPADMAVPPALEGIEPTQIWALENEREHGRLLVMGDSFLSRRLGFSRLLAEHFRRSVFVARAWTYNSLPQLVAQEHPDFVIEELVERNLGRVAARRRDESVEAPSP